MVLTVIDHGPGIDPDPRDRLFERHERGVSAIEQPGFGLGLAIVRDAVRAHGGTIDLDRAEDGGARFRIAIPRRPG